MAISSTNREVMRFIARPASRPARTPLPDVAEDVPVRFERDVELRRDRARRHAARRGMRPADPREGSARSSADALADLVVGRAPPDAIEHGVGRAVSASRIVAWLVRVPELVDPAQRSSGELEQERVEVAGCQPRAELLRAAAAAAACPPRCPPAASGPARPAARTADRWRRRDR